MVVIFLVVLALVLFLLSAWPRVNSPVNLQSLGLAALTLAYLVSHWPK